MTTTKIQRRRNEGLRKICGCDRRRWSKCPHPWHFNFKWNDTHYRFSLDRHVGRHLDSRTEAETEADRLRVEIREGRFDAPAPPTGLTFGDVVDRYLEQHVRVPTRRREALRIMEWHLKRLRTAGVPASGGATVRLEEKPLNDITKADVEAIRGALRAKYRAIEATPADQKPQRRPGVKSGEVGINRLLARLRHVFSWAIEEGIATGTPFKRYGQTVIRLEGRVETARTRRLEPGEEGRLLQHAGAHLKAVIVAALATGCRLGEILGLQWRNVRYDEQGQPWIVLDAEKTKTNNARVIPISEKSPLKGVLEMRRTDPAGDDFPPEAFVFGNEIGRRVGSIKKAWLATCRRAGISDLHFHDLRREFGSRLLESGAEHHDVRDVLGHANITTTSRYLKTTPQRLKKVLEKMEAERCKNVASEEDQPSSQPPTRTTDNRLH